MIPHTDEFPFLEPCGSEDLLGKIGIYEISQLLGDGTSSVVFKGWDPKLERTVALRVLKPHLAEVPTARARFLAENCAGSSVAHPNVISVYEVNDDGKWPFAILAFSDGETLADLCESGHEFPLEEVCQIGLAIAKALGAIHDAEFIHGDLKPSNALIDQPSGNLRLTDFGGPPGQGATPLYRSPEQVDERSLDHRTDLFSLGVILYRMAVGKLPYEHRRGEALAKEITLVEPPAIPRSICPAWLRQLIASLLAKDPNQRPATAHEVVQAFERETFRRQPKPMSRRTVLWTSGILGCASVAVALSLFRSPHPKGTPVYIEGSTKSYPNLATAIAEAGPRSRIVLRDGVHELPGLTTIFNPLEIVAEEDSHPIIRSRDTAKGTLFQVNADTTFRGITLSHVMVEASKSGSLVRASEPLTFIQCRLEHVWKGSSRVGPRPATIRTYAPVTLRRTEIDATATLAINSRLDRDGQRGQITVDECAIAAQTAFYLHTEQHPGTYEISLVKSHILAGTVCTMAEDMVATPNVKLEDCVFEADQMIASHQEAPVARNAMETLSWQGSSNFYCVRRFLKLYRKNTIPVARQSTLQGWLSLCPQAREADPHNVVESLLQPERPRSARDIPTWMERIPKTTAHDLSIQHPVVLRRYPTRGGDMSKVGPHAIY